MMARPFSFVLVVFGLVWSLMLVEMFWSSVFFNDFLVVFGWVVMACWSLAGAVFEVGSGNLKNSIVESD